MINLDHITGTFTITDGQLFLEIKEHESGIVIPGYMTVPLTSWGKTKPIALLFFTNLHTFKPLLKSEKQKRTYILTSIIPATLISTTVLWQSEKLLEQEVWKTPLLLSENPFSRIQGEFQHEPLEDLRSFLYQDGR